MQKAARRKVKRLRFLSQKDFTKRDSYGIILQNPISIISYGYNTSSSIVIIISSLNLFNVGINFLKTFVFLPNIFQNYHILINLKDY